MSSRIELKGIDQHPEGLCELHDFKKFKCCHSCVTKQEIYSYNNGISSGQLVFNLDARGLGEGGLSFSSQVKLMITKG